MNGLKAEHGAGIHATMDDTTKEIQVLPVGCIMGSMSFLQSVKSYGLPSSQTHSSTPGGLERPNQAMGGKEDVLGDMTSLLVSR